MKKLIPFLLFFGFAGIAFALPYYQQTNGLVPDVTNRHYIGTSSPSLIEYRGIYVKDITISGTCTGCSAGSQTPWTQAIDGAGFALTNAGNITATKFVATSTTATSTFQGLSFTSATGTNIVMSGSSTFPWLNSASSSFTTLAVPSISSAIMLTNGNGVAAAYSGTTCTNQFVRVLSALGAATCATVSASDVSLANLTATDGTLTFSGTYTGATARTIGLNLGNANTWTALQTFGGFISTASSTSIGGLTMTTATTTNATSTNLYVSGGLTQGNLTGFISATTTKGFNIASTSLDAMGKSFNIGTSTFLLMNDPRPLTLLGFYCVASTTGTALVTFAHDNGNVTENSTCTSGGFTRTTTNNTFTANESFNVKASSTAGTVNRITVTPSWYYTSN